mmetsp:Transcript_39485/g.45937  ORF Transcript_39485/g.45937 Transcript_39485/m.45937 type:complete len:179 (+) Transcript_39485:61-597(+)|eukprot:CAMPEP_0176442974 /NCGR_PEP_ID=MMETSP0127-20121128/22139_1 /TAXON_ID=938130 /ORGANISM="Platyophrya macrostoma, Strain WH" /LENGTH=178 /DNA_ID=CAMNT_0017828099 /DNA_START=54 /DNA_END=590 /DNA_ORIENTATION=+
MNRFGYFILESDRRTSTTENHPEVINLSHQSSSNRGAFLFERFHDPIASISNTIAQVSYDSADDSSSSDEEITSAQVLSEDSQQDNLLSSLLRDLERNIWIIKQETQKEHRMRISHIIPDFNVKGLRRAANGIKKLAASTKASSSKPMNFKLAMRKQLITKELNTSRKIAKNLFSSQF